MDQDNQQLNIDTSGEESEAVTRKRVRFWDVLLWVLIVLLTVAVFVRAFVVSKVTVSGESMTSAYYDDTEPSLTYHSGDTVTVNKLKKPQRGDVVVFYKHPVKSKFLGLFARGESVEPDGEYYKLIKRAVALGGDRLWLERVDDGIYKLVILTAEGDRLHEDYYKKDGVTLSVEGFILNDSNLGLLVEYTEQNPLEIQEGYFFAIGDNRANSADSRGSLGQVPISQLFGVVIGG